MIVSCLVQHSLFTWAYWHVVVQEQPLLLLTEYSQGLWCRGISKPGPSAVCSVVVLGLFVLKRAEAAPRWATWATCQNREWKQPGTAVLTVIAQ